MGTPSPVLNLCVWDKWFVSLGVVRTTNISPRPPITCIWSPKTLQAENVHCRVQFYIITVANRATIFNGTQTSPHLWYLSVKAAQRLLLKVRPGQCGCKCACALQQVLTPPQQDFSGYFASDELCVELRWEKTLSCVPFLRKPVRALRRRVLTSKYEASTGGKASPSWRSSLSSGCWGPQCLQAWRKLCLDDRVPRQSPFANSAAILSIFQN